MAETFFRHSCFVPWGNPLRKGGVGRRVFAPGPATLDGVTLSESPNKLLIPVREIANALDLPFGMAKGKLVFGGSPLAPSGPMLADGTRLVPLASLAKLGVGVTWDGKNRRARLARKGKALYVRQGQKRVTIDKTTQTLRGLQGTRTVIRSRVGTGVEAKDTPNGIFAVQPYRARLHISSIYEGARMPYAVQIVGNIFVHGWPKVRGVPASHGCIHLPVTGANPARFFYLWADEGTPVVINGRWRG